jgi:two-component system, sensor histidine kinase and response regulator
MTKILIIEDDPVMREFVSFILSSAGYTAIEAADAQIGLELCRRHLPQLIISDIVMEGIDGYSAVAALREDPAAATVPIILMTANKDANGMRRGMALGADDFLYKPFSAAALLASVETQQRKQAMFKQHAERAMQDLRSNINMAFPHELNTPLNGILGCAEILKAGAEDLKPAEIVEMADCITVSAQRMQRLTDQFLTYMQTEATAADPTQQAILKAARTPAATTLIEEVARGVAELYDRAADLRIEIEQRICLEILNENLRRIAEQLTQNAFRFSKKGSSVRISGERVGAHFSLKIRDHGRGMVASQITHVGAYAQFDRKVHAHEGLGLGLTIARRLTELHGGELLIESVPNEGTTVEVRLTVSDSS